MEDVIGIRIHDGKLGVCALLSYGRVFDSTDSDTLVKKITPELYRFGLNEVKSIEICSSLRDVRNSEYFFEGLLKVADRRASKSDAWESYLAALSGDFNAFMKSCFFAGTIFD